MTAIRIVQVALAVAAGCVLGLFVFSLLCTIAARTWFRVRQQFTATWVAGMKGASNGKQR